MVTGQGMEVCSILYRSRRRYADGGGPNRRGYCSAAVMSIINHSGTGSVPCVAESHRIG